MQVVSLARQLAGPEIVVAPGVFDGFGAAMAAAAGFNAVYLSGASLAYSRFGRPDIGLVSMSEVAETLSNIRERVETPIIVDADTGFGNALNVQRTVKLFERCGAACIQLEDQTLPKRCGHLAGKSLVSVGEAVGKIHAALDSRVSDDTLIMARTDAIAVEGFDAALERAERYLAAGADLLFIEAPQSLAEMRALTDRFAGRVPLLANMVEGGATPTLSAPELQDLGYALAIFPGGLMRARAYLEREFFASLKQSGSTAAFRDRSLGFQEFNDLLGTQAMLDAGGRYDGANFEPGDD